MAPNVISRPLLYITLPSIAFVLSFLWLRRKKPTVVHCDTGGSQNSPEVEVAASADKQPLIADEVAQKSNHRLLNHSQSVPIATGKGGAIEPNSGDTKFGKSAPINIPIAGNGIGSGFGAAVLPELIDPELLNLKIKDSEFKQLRSIEEDEDDLESELQSSLDLPESLPDHRRRLFGFAEGRVHANQPEPIVVKATMAAKISPENSFVETKYTEECSDEASDDTSKVQTRKFEAKTELSALTTELMACDDDKDASSHTAPVASPPLSLCSMQSADSGKGSSPPQSVCTQIVYEFLLPQNLVGQLIGRKGSHVQTIKNKTGVNIVVKKLPDPTLKIKVCSLEGATQSDVDAALAIIRHKLPEKQYPNVTLARVFTGDISADPTMSPFTTIDSPSMQLELIEGINNDVAISAIVSGGHLFVQQPLHPSFPSLATLQVCLNQIYSLTESPAMPEVMGMAMCVAYVGGNWYRVLVIEQKPKTDSTSICVVRFLDYGGFAEVDSSNLRQIRKDCMTVPFQAIECVLADVRPPHGADEWSPQATEVLASLASGIILQAQVVGYTQNGIPEVSLYACHAPDNIVFINKELVAQGLAEYVGEPSMQIA